MTEIDTSKPHPARMYDYYLRGKTNYLADREAAEEVLRTFPWGRTVARTQRDLMGRATQYLTGEAGVGQYLDIGTGIPTEPNLHQIAQEITPGTRVVYVDNDPIVKVYAEALLYGSAEGTTEFLLADVTAPESIYGSAEIEVLDLSRPVALCLLGILQFLPDDTDTAALVRSLVDPLPSGSYLALSTLTHEFDPEMWSELRGIYRQGGMALRTYTKDEVTGFFDGLDLVDPGVVVSNRWRPELRPSETHKASPASVSMFAGIARKP